VIVCPACGKENPEGFAFCGFCTAPLTAEVEAPREERKVVSIVFVDLVGSTALAEGSDPEDVRALLRVYHQRAREELEGFGGTVEKFIGDAVVAVFGAPAAHEDDPERAVRAALAVREAVEGLNDERPESDLHVRIGVNTGEALVSLDAAPGEGEGMVAGDVVNTAARLQAAAPVDGILVGEQTYRATDREIVYRDIDPVDAKGKSQPIAAWEAVEARARLGVDLGGAGRAELVGRDAELDLLVDALTRARRGKSTQLVTLVGVPGIGKSRLVYELGRHADEDEELITWRQGRSLPYGEGVSFWALGEVVKAQAGILESDPAADAAAKLATALVLVQDEQEREWVERHLRPLVGLGADDAAGDRRGEAFAAWRRYLESVAESGPTVLVFEDLHWADDGLLDFVDGLVDWVDGVPLLVVCTARPELLERRPGWGGGKRNAATISLTPLDEAATVRLVHALLEHPLIAADAQRALVERAGGNPLYAEEFVRMLEAGGSAGSLLPATVQGIVAARIDLLPAREKELLQHAAVLGKVFWSDALIALGDLEGWQLDETLRSLERKEFVRREHRSAVAGANQYAFVHALVRDAAYGQLPRQARADRHAAAAAWIESLPEDRAEDRAETLAYHYLTAIELRRAAGDDVDGLRVRAVGALQEAGERALALNAFDAAARFLAQAIELLPEEDQQSPELLFAAARAFGFVGRLGDEFERAMTGFERAGEFEQAAECAVAASWHVWHVDPPQARAWVERAAELLGARPASRPKALVLAEQARLAMVNLSFETALGLAEEAAALAREIGDDEIRADALVTYAAALGAGERRIELLEEALELVGRRGRVASRGYTNLGVACVTLGDLTRSRQVLEEGLARAKREGDAQGAVFIEANLLETLYVEGDWDGVRQLLDSMFASSASTYQVVMARDVGAKILVARGDLAQAEADRRADLEHARGLEDLQTVLPALLEVARLARRQGREDEWRSTMRELRDGFEASESVGDPMEWHVSSTLELVLFDPEAARALVARMPDTLWREASVAVAEGAYAEAADILARIGEKPLQAELRLLAARSLADAGRPEEAERQLELATSFWRSVGATAYLREAEDLLAEAS
jgi:predicted ATPase/class 3 adenylate cyclase